MKTVDVERSSVSVEWYEGGSVKGKEVSEVSRPSRVPLPQIRPPQAVALRGYFPLLSSED